jgi:hypothetical protein
MIVFSFLFVEGFHKLFSYFSSPSLLGYVNFLLFPQFFPSLKHFDGVVRVKNSPGHFGGLRAFSQFAGCFSDSLEHRHEDRDHRSFQNMH